MPVWLKPVNDMVLPDAGGEPGSCHGRPRRPSRRRPRWRRPSPRASSPRCDARSVVRVRQWAVARVPRPRSDPSARARGPALRALSRTRANDRTTVRERGHGGGEFARFGRERLARPLKQPRQHAAELLLVIVMELPVCGRKCRGALGVQLQLDREQRPIPVPASVWRSQPREHGRVRDREPGRFSRSDQGHSGEAVKGHGDAKPESSPGGVTAPHDRNGGVALANC